MSNLDKLMSDEELLIKLKELQYVNNQIDESLAEMYKSLGFTLQQLSDEFSLFIEVNDYIVNFNDIEFDTLDEFSFWLAERYNWDIKNGKFK